MYPHEASHVIETILHYELSIVVLRLVKIRAETCVWHKKLSLCGDIYSGPHYHYTLAIQINPSQTIDWLKNLLCCGCNTCIQCHYFNTVRKKTIPHWFICLSIKNLCFFDIMIGYAFLKPLSSWEHLPCLISQDSSCSKTLLVRLQKSYSYYPTEFLYVILLFPFIEQKYTSKDWESCLQGFLERYS